MTPELQSTTVGIAAPPGFAVAEFDEIKDFMAAYNKSHPDAWGSFVAAWKGLIYRYRAAFQHNEEFGALVSLDRPPTYEERYLQDHALFVFSICALSSCECFFFGANCLGAAIDQTAFPVSNDRELRFTPRKVVQRFEEKFSRREDHHGNAG